MSKNIEELLSGLSVEETNELLKDFKEESSDEENARIRAIVGQKIEARKTKEPEKPAVPAEPAAPVAAAEPTAPAAPPARPARENNFARRRKAWLIAAVAATAVILTLIAILPAALQNESPAPAGPSETREATASVGSTLPTETDCPAKDVEENGLHFALDAEEKSYILYDVSVSTDSVEIPASVNGLPVTAVTPNALAMVSANSVTLPATVEMFSSSLVNANANVKAVYIAEGNSYYMNVGNAVIEMNGNCLILCYDDEVPAGVRRIAASTFEGRATLERLDLPEGLEVIELRAFADCPALVEVSLPASLTALSDEAFAGCAALRRVTVCGAVASVGRGVFNGCQALEEIVFYGGEEEWNALFGRFSDGDLELLSGVRVTLMAE